MTQSRPTARLMRSLIDFSRAVRAHSQHWSASGEHGLTRNEVVALGLFADQEACRASAVSERMNVGPSVVSRLVAAMARRGLLERQTDPADGRAELIRVTPAGMAALRAARSANVDALARHLHDWDAARIDGAADLLDELTDALTQNPKETR